VHDEKLDRSGYARDSTGGYVKAGTSFEFTRILFGEISIGYAARDYVDNRLDRLQGLLVSSSLTWQATPLTTGKFISDTQIAETTLPGTPACWCTPTPSRSTTTSAAGSRESANSPSARSTIKATTGRTRSTLSKAI